MQTASAPKDNSEGNDQPGASGLNWRQRKKANMRRKQLVDGYTAALGGSSRITAIQLRDIERAVDMTMLAEAARAKALRGDKVAITDLVRLEGAADRAVRRLNLPASHAGPPVQTLAEYLASRHAASDEAEG
jgi:DNA-binding helix-hairpin-helix protein with protein kinase domain